MGSLKFLLSAASARVSDVEGIHPDTGGSMRQLRLLSVLAAVVALLCGCATQVMSTALVSAQTTRPLAVPTAPAGWTTVFKDDFAGRAGSAPSAKNWFYDIGTGYGTGEIEHTTNSTRNVYVDGHGHLVLKATRSGGTWRSGRIESTRDDFAAPPGGELELTASIKQPHPANGLGYWPAFWALGSPMRKGGGWPASGEIDMMEDVNGLNEASQTLHQAAGSSGHPLIPCRGSRCESGYHTYSVIINRTNTRAEYLRFLMDGRVTDTITEASVGAAAWHKAIDHGFFIIFDLAMGGNYPDGECNCTVPTSATTPGGAMSVAYVAVYKKRGAPAKTTTTAASPGSGAPPASFWGNTRNIPAAKKVLGIEVINRANGHVRDSGLYWSFDGTEKSIAQQPYIDIPSPGQRPVLPARRKVRGLLHQVRRVARRQGRDHRAGLRLRRHAVRQPSAVRCAEPPRRAASGIRAVGPSAAQRT